MMRFQLKHGLSIPIAICALVAAWEWTGAHVRGFDLFFPRPSTLWAFAFHHAWELSLATLWTLLKVMAGLTVGAIMATVVSLGGVWFPRVRSPLSRAALASQTFPVPLLTPLLGLAFGFNAVTATAVVALICFFPIYLGWEQGQLALSDDVVLLAKSYRPTRLRYTLLILVPAALPYALLGTKGAINLAVLGAVLAEFVGTGDGLGRLMLRGIRELTPAKSWGAMVIVILIAASLTEVASRTEKHRRFSYLGDTHDSQAPT